MKKNNIAAILCAASLTLFSQPYGEVYYSNGSTMTSGAKTSVHSSGFVMSGLINTWIGPGFHIDKTDVGGGFNMFCSSCFERDYYLVASTCGSSSYGGYRNISGVSTIETNGVYHWYATVGAYDEACFLSLITSSGGPATRVYPFPYPSLNIDRPSIVQSQTASRDYFVCGKFDTSMYVMRIDTTGALVWSSFYTAGSSGSGLGLDPNAIIESPFSGEVVIVGRLDGPLSYSRAADGFFLSLNSNSGAINNFSSHGDGTSSSVPCNLFTSITPAKSTYGGSVGYVIGGYSDFYMTNPTNTGHSWVVKVDLNGNQLWSKIITSFNDINNGMVQGVVERLNNSNNYEYYAAAQTNVGVVDGGLVFKLDDSGLPVHVNFPLKQSEFFYPQGTAQYPIDLSYNDGAPSDNGLHLYVNDAGNHHLYEAYFNGVHGCNEMLVNAIDYENGPSYINPWIVAYGSLTDCVDGGYDMVNTNNNLSSCGGGSIPGGSNARTAVVSGLGVMSKTGAARIYPNPGTGVYHLELAEKSEAAIYNILGERVGSLNLSAGDNILDLQDQPKGIYFVKLRNSNGVAAIEFVKE